MNVVSKDEYAVVLLHQPVEKAGKGRHVNQSFCKFSPENQLEHGRKKYDRPLLL